MGTEDFIAFHRPSIGREEIEEVTATLQSGWLTTGERTLQFEREFRAYVGAPYSLAVNSCTAALHLALVALGIGPGDEVITTPLTFCATVNCIIHTGAMPVLADIDCDGNMDPASIIQRITPRTRALLPVHFAGLPCNMDAIWKIARERGLYVIEDAAHALAAEYRGFPIGAGDPARGFHSDAVAYSFYATKSLTTGEGGMLTSHSEALIEAARVLCLHGITKDAWNRYSARGNWHYQVVRPGFKYNLSDVQSSIGLPQLRKQDTFRDQRAAHARFYAQQLAEIAEIELPQESTDSVHAWHLYAIKLNLQKLSIDRDEFIRQLHAKGIGTSVHFIPIPLHPFFAPYAELPQNACPKALDLYPRLVSLPIYPSLRLHELTRVVESIKSVVHSNRARLTVSAATAGF